MKLLSLTIAREQSIVNSRDLAVRVTCKLGFIHVPELISRYGSSLSNQ